MLNFLYETFRLGLKNLRLHKLRSLLTALGIIIGIAGSVVLGRFLSSLLFGVTSSDPVAIVGASVTLLSIGIIAALIPAVDVFRNSRLRMPVW